MTIQVPMDIAADHHTVGLAKMIARQAARTPGAPAVLTAEGDWSYQELNAHANRLAHHLIGLGIGPGDLVGVYLNRSPELVSALLAAWKAGAGYVPLDPAQPDRRTGWIVSDSKPAVVLTTQPLAGRLPGAPVLLLDAPGFQHQPATDPVAEADPAGAAYQIYTSGSTGHPKGVLITHEGIANRVLWTIRTHQLGPSDRVLQKTSIGFDAAGWEFFAPLVSGGTVALAPVGTERDQAGLLRAARELGATILQVVPSVLRMLVEEPGWAQLPALRLLLSAGEPLRAELCRTALDRAGRTDLDIWNTYGPTECSIDITAQRYDHVQATGPVPIGVPIDGTRVAILDEYGEPVPSGVPGELHAAGAGVARGYPGRPDLTAERFVPDPRGQPGARLYRTGDLARWRGDGTLEYLGRVDQQVKINGVRIEPAEVEAALMAHPEVSAAVVTAVERNDASHLVGYVVGRQGQLPAGLRSFVRDLLPESMVPATLVPLDRIPLTANGKVDRKALPDPGLLGRPAHIAPRTPAEAAIAEVWASLLGLDEVGAQDDFFHLGGSSLQLTRLAARLRGAFPGQLKLPDLFTATTVEAQARLVSIASLDQPVLPVGRDADLPLSFGEERLRFLDRMNPGGPEWISPVFIRLPADADRHAVQRALNALEARHEALRSRYPVGGTARRVITEPGPVDLRETATDPAGLGDVLAAQFSRGFDLEAGPLWRAVLIRGPRPAATLLLTIHHIACDGWSATILEREFAELYAAEARGEEAKLPRLAVSYRDFAAWQRTWMTDEALAQDLDYWTAELESVRPLTLPADRPRPAERDHRGAILPFRIEASLADALVSLGRARGATPFMVLLTGFAVLLARYSGERDVTIGTPVAGRIRPETEPMVGFFLNSLAMRVRLSGDLSFEQALDAVRVTCLAGFAHQSLPFERLVDQVEGGRDLSRTPVYQVAFDLQDEGLISGGADFDELEMFQQAWRIAKTDLTLFFRRLPDQTLQGVFEYATSLFDEQTMLRLAGHFRRLLHAVAQDPAGRLGDIELVTAQEYEQQLARWAPAAAPLPPAAETVLDLIESQAAARPGEVAVWAGSHSTTFAELDVRANQLGHHLRSLGVAPETVVGVLLSRGPDLLPALLGTWKAGGAYLPLEPGDPPGRIAAALTDAGARALVTDSAHAAAMADAWDGELVVADRDRATIDASPASRPERRQDPGHTAYVIFTSGSTGRPKGVWVEHRGLANHVRWAARALAGRSPGGAVLFSSTAFDLVVPTLYAPLAVGHPVHLLPADLDLSRLGPALAERAPYAFIKLTPSHLEIVAQQLDDGQATALAGTLLVAGEAFSGEQAARWLRLLGPGRLVNEYGPTECTVGTSIHPVDADPGRPVVPIGRPLPGMTMHVLDERGRPVPVGVAGELHVGGVGVARGYGGRPDLTAERFLPDPYGPAGARFYRTGDRARRLPDGTVEFLGRIDHQVKIRGYRIEPGEIAAVLAAHPAIREAVVVPVEDEGRGRLVAYLVPVAEPPAAAELDAHCAGTLPAYMVPSSYVTLAALPLNANGKLDRSALPAPGADGPARERVAPRDVAEERIAGIWAELLGAEPDVHDDFFALGGNSILGIRLIAQIQAAFEVDLPLRALFEGATVARLARAVTSLIEAEVDNLSDDEVLSESMLYKEHDQ
jgi:amino acid adenylation domain-containing protein